MEVNYYHDQHGKSEIGEFIDRLAHSSQKQDVAVLKKLAYQIELLKGLGTNLGMPQAKFLKGYRHKLWELRPLPERVFYTTWDGKAFLLVSHYTKKQNKTDPRQIERVLNLIDDWERRHRNG
ncbi:type II toxin-antitoxin system RelE/ParE family toxin [Limosilactobacillus ingluviei]